MPAIPKPRAPKLLKADRKAAREKIDKAHSDEVRERSGGQCEVWELTDLGQRQARCQHRAVHVHHMIGGIGTRARGISALATHKQHVCARCHADIGGRVLYRLGDVLPRWTDCYERETR